jgi:regulator of protease activity HflC (stomatin/prohibitin superfamily)
MSEPERNPEFPFPHPDQDPSRWKERLRAVIDRGDGFPPLRRLAVAVALLLAALLAARAVGRAFREVHAGHAAIAVNRFTGGVRVLPPGTYFVPRALYGLTEVRVSDQLLAGREATLDVSTKEGLSVSLAIQARWAVDRGQLLARWASLPPDPAREVVAPILASAFRALAPAYDATSILTEKREELAARAAERARGRLLEAGLVLKDLLVSDVKLPPEYEKARLALLEEQQSVERKSATLKLKEKEIEQGRLEAEAEKVRKEKAAETEASQKLIAAKAEADAMQWVLPLKEKLVKQQELEAEADRAKKLKEAQAQAEAGQIETEAEAKKRRTMADAEAYAIRATSAAQFENLKREVELVQANPVWVSKTFAEKISDKVQVILAPNLAHDPFTGEMLKHLANGQPALPARQEQAGRAPAPSPTPDPESEDAPSGTR